MTTPACFPTTLKADTTPPRATAPAIEVTLVEASDAPVHLRPTTTPDTVVTTDRHRWHAFVLGVQAGGFDHFA
ncbi:hypothetical protein ACW4TU_20855 [Streptomyces sp. QTS52]